ncbi:glycosyltransferase [Anaeromyxobacter oryzae]|uniref:Arabinose kinase n=1 Tax=Anaeromyxobacter oryzae TaxID=2918170 RepID=A0ABN6MZV0_9BACT|nr:hypothetical protein [Anaeromyxobacter oryzae]BDG05268.1 arabinose kinase [Anaeromyxobacter oryzae]
MLAAYVSGHGYGHLTRLCEVLRAVRTRAPRLPITIVGTVPEPLVRRAVPGDLTLRRVACDVGLVQRDALVIDEPATAARCAAFDATWDARLADEVAFLRESGTRAVLGDLPPLAFAAARAAGVPGLALGNFSWDWIYRHLSVREPSLAAHADRAARAYAGTDLLLELPFTGDVSVFPRRERIGLVARRPRVERAEARRRLGLDARPAVLVSFGGVGLPGLDRARLAEERGLSWILPEDVRTGRLDALGLDYPDVIGAADAVVTKPGYGIVSDCVAAGTPLVYTDRGDFPEYPVLVREMVRLLPCVHVPGDDVRAGRIGDAVRRVLAAGRPGAGAMDLGGAERGAARVLEAVR